MDGGKVSLEDLFGKKPESYWDLLADHTCKKIREIGRVSGYEKAGIEYVQFRVHLDNRTTKICRAMHVRIIVVKDMRSHVNSYLDACASKNKKKIKDSWPWISDKDAMEIAGKKTSDLIRDKVIMPPFMHGADPSPLHGSGRRKGLTERSSLNTVTERKLKPMSGGPTRTDSGKKLKLRIGFMSIRKNTASPMTRSDQPSIVSVDRGLMSGRTSGVIRCIILKTTIFFSLREGIGLRVSTPEKRISGVILRN